MLGANEVRLRDAACSDQMKRGDKSDEQANESKAK